MQMPQLLPIADSGCRFQFDLHFQAGRYTVSAAHSTPAGLDACLDDRQAESDAAAGLIARGVNPVERSENVVKSGGGNTGTVVGDAEPHLSLYRPSGDFDGSGVSSVTDRVADYVGNSSKQVIGVGPNVEGGIDIRGDSGGACRFPIENAGDYIGQPDRSERGLDALYPGS